MLGSLSKIHPTVTYNFGLISKLYFNRKSGKKKLKQKNHKNLSFKKKKKKKKLGKKGLSIPLTDLSVGHWRASTQVYGENLKEVWHNLTSLQKTNKKDPHRPTQLYLGPLPTRALFGLQN